MREALAEYLRLVVRSWWAVISVVAGLLVLVGDLASLGIPKWIWWLVVGVATVVAQFEAFRHVREEREKVGAAAASGGDAEPQLRFRPELFEGRLLPWISYPIVTSNEKALVIRCALALAADNGALPVTSDLQKLFEDATAESALEGWFQRETGVHRSVPPEQWWKRVHPTNDQMVTLVREPTRIDYYPFTVGGQCVLDTSAGRLLGSEFRVMLASVAFRRDDLSEAEPDSQPLSLEGLYSALRVFEAALVDQIAPRVLAARGQTPRLISYAALAIASSGDLSEYVGLRIHGWPRAEGSYEQNALWGRPGDESAVLDTEARDLEIKSWLQSFLSKAGYSDFEHDVEHLEASMLPVPVST